MSLLDLRIPLPSNPFSVGFFRFWRAGTTSEAFISAGLGVRLAMHDDQVVLEGLACKGNQVCGFFLAPFFFFLSSGLVQPFCVDQTTAINKFPCAQPPV